MTGPDLPTVFASTLAEHYSRIGGNPEDPATATTIRVNSTLVEKRAETLFAVMRRLLGLGSLEGLRVLEAGSGFGALAAYLALGGPSRVVGVDTNPEYVRIGRESAERLGLDGRLEFECADMQAMPALPDASFDLVIANNSFLYLATAEAADRGLSEFRRVLAPGGALLIYQANRWRLSEPFTKDPIVHLLPPPLAEAVARRTGWRHNHGRVRLSSSGQLRRAMKRAGLRPVGTIGFGRGGVRHTRPVARNFGNWFAQAGRRLG